MSRTAKDDAGKFRHAADLSATFGENPVSLRFHVREAEMSSKDASGVWGREVPQAACEKGRSGREAARRHRNRLTRRESSDVTTNAMSTLCAKRGRSKETSRGRFPPQSSSVDSFGRECGPRSVEG